MRVPEDTPGDAIFGGYSGAPGAQVVGPQLRVLGTAVIQQGTPDDGLTEAVLDSIPISSTFDVLTNEYQYTANYRNTTLAGNNQDNAMPSPDYAMAVTQGNAKSKFEAALWSTLSELEAKGWLRDILRMSETAGFLNNVQIASSTSFATGSQASASIILDYRPMVVGGVDRPDLGGNLDLVFDKFTAFYHS
jgi:hypothetical protein